MQLFQVIDISRDVLKASLVGLGGDDIADGKRKPILALVWQLMRIHTLQVLRSAAGGSLSALSEADVLNWANQILTLQKSQHTIPSFKHPSLSTGHAVLELLRAIEPHAVQDSYIHPGTLWSTLQVKCVNCLKFCNSLKIQQNRKNLMEGLWIFCSV